MLAGGRVLASRESSVTSLCASVERLFHSATGCAEERREEVESLSSQTLISVAALAPFSSALARKLSRLEKNIQYPNLHWQVKITQHPPTHPKIA